MAYGLLIVKNMLRDFLIPFFIFVTGTAAFSFGIAFASSAFGMMPILTLGFIPTWLVSLFLAFRYHKRRLFLHLAEAARIGGKDVMMSALEKINSLNIPEVERGKNGRGLMRRIWPVPNIIERIEYLRRLE